MLIFLTGAKEIFSFSYSDSWLKSRYSQILDPELQLFSGSQYAKDEKQNFGVFLDSSPDRWGLFNPPGIGPFDKDPDDDIPFHGFDPEE